MNLTLPQLISIRHFYYKQMVAELNAGMPGKQTPGQAQHSWEEFRRGLNHG